jgi:hypothetical protein
MSRRGNVLGLLRNLVAMSNTSAGTTQAESFTLIRHAWAKPVLVILLTSFVVVAPMMFLGNASGHDFEFHMNSWMEVASQWKQGIIYPRWAALAHYGYGEARFLFYPPGSWMLGALLGTILPWTWVAGAYVWLVLTGAGTSMYLLTRRWLSPGDALFASALYAANPYHLVVVYWRSALAELLASTLLPLLLLLVLRAERDKWKVVVPLSLLIAAAWLTNAPSAVMVNYSLALLAVTYAIVKRAPRVLLYAGAAVALGACLAGYYLVPAAYEEQWVNIAQVLAPGVRPQDNFLFTNTSDADHNRFNLLVSAVAAAELSAVLAGIWLTKKRRNAIPALWWSVVAWGVTASLLLFSFTSSIWLHLPKLRFVQLPWRWLLCLNVAFAMLITMGVKRSWVRLTLCLAMLAVIIYGARKIQPPWWDNSADVMELVDQVQSGAGYEGTDEYVPIAADPYEIDHQAARATVQGDGGHSRIHIENWSPETKILSAQVSAPAALVLKLFNYPAWKVEVNGRFVVSSSTDVTGQMTIPLERGKNIVKVIFARTKDRIIGQILSGIAVLILLVWIVWNKRNAHGVSA